MFLSSLPAQNGQFSVVLDSLSAVTCSVALLSHNNNIIYAIFCIITSLLFVDVFDSLVESNRYGCSGVHHEFHHHHPHILFLQWMALKLSPALLQTCLYFAAAQTYRGVRKWHICMRCCAQILKLLLLCSAGYFWLYFPLKVWQAVILFLIIEEKKKCSSALNFRIPTALTNQDLENLGK